MSDAASARFGGAARLGVVLGLASLTACAPGLHWRPAGDAASVTEEQVAERRALGPIDAASGDVARDLARLRAIARFSRAVGDSWEHGRALTSMLARARAHRVASRGAGEAASEAQLVETRRFVLSEAIAEGSEQRALAALENVRDVAPYADLVAQLGQGRLTGRADLAPEVIAALPIRWRMELHESSSEPMAEIAPLGVLAHGVLSSELWRARVAEDRPAFLALCRRLLELDGWNVGAHLALRLGAEPATAALVFRVPLRDQASVVDVTALELAARARPDDATVALARAWALAARGLGPDARRAVDAAPPGGADARWWALVGALADARGGRGAAALALFAAHGDAPASLLVHSALAASAQREPADEALASAARASSSALLRRFGRDAPWTAANALVADPSAPIDERRLALDALAYRSEIEATTSAACLDRELSTEDCERLREAVSTLEYESFIEASALEQLGARPNLPSEALYSVLRRDGEDAAARRAWLEGLRGSRLALSEAWAATRVRAALVAEEFDAAERALREGEPVISVSVRAALRAEILDARAGRTAVPVHYLAPLAGWRGRVAPATPDSGLLERWTAASSALRRGEPAPVEEWLAPLVAALDGEERALVHALLGRHAAAQGDGEGLARHAAAARAAAPRSADAAFLEGLIAERAGRLEPAFEAYRQAWLRRPHGDLAGAAVVRLRAQLDAARPAREALEWLSHSRDHDLLAAILEHGLAATPAALLEAHDAALREPHRADVRLAAHLAPDAVSYRARGYVRDAETPALAAARAREVWPMVQAVAASPRASAEVFSAWLGWRAGDARGAEALLRRVRGLTSDEVLYDALPIAGAADPALAQAISEGMQHAGGVLEPATLDAIAARARADASWRPLACSALAFAERADEALGPCVAAHRAGHGSAAIRLAWALGAASPEARAAVGLAEDSFLATLHARADEGGGWIAQRLAERADERRDPREAARWRMRAIAAGWRASDPELIDFDTAAFRGPTVRAQLGAGAVSELASAALAEGRPELAQAYLEAPTRPRHTDEALAARDYRFLMGDLVAWAADDLAEQRITREGVGSFERLRVRNFDRERVVALARQFPRASLTAFAIGVRSMADGDGLRSVRALASLLDRSPRPSALVPARSAWTLIAGEDEYERRRGELAGRFPEDPRLAPEAAAEEVPLPPGLTTPEGLTQRFERASAALSLEEAQLTRMSLGAVGAEIAVPPDATPRGGRLAVSWEGVSTAIASEARHSDCSAETCADQIVPEFVRLGFSPRVRAPVSLPIGDGLRLLMTQGPQVLLLTIAPVGLRVYAVVSGGAVGELATAMQLHRLSELTLRPTDIVVGAERSAQIRGDAADAAPWAQAWRARVALEAASGTECPLQDELASLELPARAGVLRAIYLSSRDVGVRRRVAACAPPEEGVHGALGVAAVLDPDVGLHDYGRRAMASDVDASLALVEALAALPPEIPQAGTERELTELPRFGLVEMIGGLPLAARGPLVERLTASEDPRVRALAYASDFVAGGTISAERAREIMRGGAPGAALGVLDSFYGPLTAADRAAIRARMDAIADYRDPLSRRLASRLSFVLARNLEREDLPRFQRMLDATEGDESSGALRLRGRARWDRDVVRHALGIEASELTSVQRAAERYRMGLPQLRGPRTVSARVAERLATAPLAEVLPGGDWQYVRVPQPALFLASLRQLYSRLRSSTAADTALARQILERIVTSGGGDLLAEDGGLDLQRPVECARTDTFPPAWVCAAYVRDRDAVRQALSRRDYGHNSGLALAMDVAGLAMSLPTVAGALPATVDSMLEVPEPEAPSTPEAGAVLDRQRVRATVDLGGVEVERFGVFSVREDDSPGADTEHYLFTGDRVLVFGLETTARAILRRPLPRSRTLAGDATFQRLSRGWSDGAVLQMANVDVEIGGGAPMPWERFALELVADGAGVVTRLQTPLAAEEVLEVSSLEARLPPGAIAQISLALPPSNRPDANPPDADDSPNEPPFELLAAASGFAFGWYPTPSDGHWDHWVAVVRATDAMTAALAERGVALPGDGETEVGGLRYARRGALLIVGTHEADVRHALGAPSAAGEGDHVGAGRLDGVRGARYLGALASRLAPEDPRRGSLSMLATMVGVGRELSFDAQLSPDGRTLRLVTRALPNLAAAGADDALIDQALRSRRNALTLPRRLRDAERQRALTYVFESREPDAALQRIFAGRRRVEARRVGADRVVVTVSAESAPEPLSPAERTRLTAPESVLSSGAPAIEAAAAEIAPVGASVRERAAATARWVHARLRYELTSANFDAATILLRRRGDCTEFARLTVALLRARGVPAEVRSGFATAAGELVAHAWVTYYDGERFRELDPTSGSDGVSSTHVPMSVTDAIAFASVGELRIVEIR